MAALLGYVGECGAGHSGKPRGWEAAVARLGSRSGPEQEIFVGTVVGVAYRGRNLGGYFRDISYIILLDGVPDQLRQTASDGLAAGGAAEQLANLVRSQGIAALDELTGNFSAAIVDLAQQQVYLMRDRFGAKPLFWARVAGGWCWASEMKFLLPLLDQTELNREALSEAVYFRWLAGERTLVRGIQQVMPSHGVELQAGSEPRRRRHFEFRFRPKASEDATVWQARLDQALDHYFGRMAKLYPRVAVLLSGGVDSSLLAAKAMRAGFQKCLAVTGQMPGFENPELPNARRVAAHLGMEHLVVEVEDSFIRDFFPQFVWRMEVPPRKHGGLVLQRLLAKTAPDVDAVIFGEGSDSMFGTKSGLWLEKYEQKQKRLRSIPWSLRTTAGRLLPQRPTGLLHRLRWLLLHTTEDLFSKVDSVDYLTPPPQIVRGMPALASINEDVLSAFDSPRSRWSERYQSVTTFTDCTCGLGMMDRLCEPLGLTVLSPFFAAELVNLASTLPSALKARGDDAKPLVRDLACKYFPKEWIYGPKHGFPTPLASWLAGPLESRRQALTQDRTAGRGLYAMDQLMTLNAERDAEMLWTVIGLESFLDQFIDREPCPSPVDPAARFGPTGSPELALGV